MIYIFLTFYIVFFIFCVAFVLFILAQLLAIFTTEAPFVPVPKEVLEEIVDNLELKGDSVLYDLGCGDACVLSEATRKNPNLKSVGVEIAFIPYLLAKFYTRNQKNITIERQDIFKANLGNATHIFLYLYPKVINKLIDNIKKQCHAGTIIISCDFQLENVQPAKVVPLKNSNPNSKRGKRLLIYTI